ncbi:putative mitochondrial protein [Cucumis melo var. makuwa]|uniref:Putative mitochondrial protein n=1 Tax=Cucumis melo var. makuwa TaxID=1194695 RepID=A0A5D3BID9_CUCMM|nr:putative mitochondrial protein [Cucumis melo var. makuwa]
MEQPPGFVAQGESDKVCLIRKSLYGLKQSSFLLVVYVDDIVITGNDASSILSLKTFLKGKLGAKPSGTSRMPNPQLVKEGELCNDASSILSLKIFLQIGKLGAKPSGTLRMPNPQLVKGELLDHWAAVEQILCYLKAASGRGILYKDHGHTRKLGIMEE